MAKALLDDLMTALECSASDMNAYFDRVNGRTIFLSDEHLRQAAKTNNDEDQERAQWEREVLADARSVLNDHEDRFVALPGSDDIHEWAIMNKFALNNKGPLSEKLYRAVRGGGAFQRFRETVERNGLSDNWYAFRTAALRTIAIEWCEENDIEYVDEVCQDSQRFCS